MEVSTGLIIVSIVVAYLLWFKSITKSMKGPKGPKMWPIVGSLPGLLENGNRMHEWIAENLRVCTGTYQTCICAIPFLASKQGLVTVTCDPKNLEHILKVRFDNYPKGPTWQAVFHDLLGEGIFNSDGDTWLFQRKTAALEFTTRTPRQAMGRWVNRAIKSRFCPILEMARVQGKPIELQDLLLRLTFDNICGLTFGKDPETLSPGLPDNIFAMSFDRATEATLHRFIIPEFIWKLKKMLGLGMEVSLSHSLKQLDNYMTDVINTRKLELSNHQNGEKESYSDKFLQHVALNFILAGRDTSSVALSWFFWLVSLNPRVEEKILIELCTVLAKKRGNDTSKWLEEPLEFEEVDQLTYLKATLSETLRLYPSVPEDSKHVISMIICLMAHSSNEIHLGRRLFRIQAERWMSQDGNKFQVQDTFRFVAFNAGPRICLGKDLAYLQMKSIAAAVLLRHRLAVAPGHKVEQKMSLTLFMKYGLVMNVTPRDLTPILAKIGQSCAGEHMINNGIHQPTSIAVNGIAA
ncbi:unnamed protein product [Withania somnifera]